MSSLFKPDVPKPAAVKEVELTAPQSRGRVGRTIIGGAVTDQKKVDTQKKAIFGG